MQINKLSDALGAEITDLDVREVSQKTAEEIYEAFLEHQILVFRNQDLTPDQQIKFSEYFGEVEVHLAKDHLHPDTDKVILISNKVQNGRYVGAVSAGDYWHSDLSCQDRPNLASFLLAIELPREGGDTGFCNQYLALDTLPTDLLKKIVSRKAVHTFNRMRNPRVRVPEMHKGDAQMRYADRAPPDAIHPIIRTHPDTGRKALYVSHRFTVGIEGMSDDESRPILDSIFEHQLNEKFIYRHKWCLGDMIMWDNRCTTHHAYGGVPPGQIRHMHRTSLIGDVPF